MVDWVTEEVGITDLEDGKAIAEAQLQENRVVICVVPPANDSAAFQYDLREPPFTEGTLNDIADVIQVLVKNHKLVIVHCYAGIDRSPLVVAWWLARYHTETLDAAYEKIREVRPQVRDRGDWVAA